MQGPVRLVKFNNTTLVLPANSYVEGGAIPLSFPYVEVEGRHGAYLGQSGKYKPRTLKLKMALVSNTLQGVGVYGLANVEQTFHDIVSFVGLEPVKLYRWTGDSRYLWVTVKSFDFTYRVPFGNKWMDLSLTIEINDPFFYEAGLSQITVSGVGPFSVPHVGNVSQNPVIILRPLTGVLVNPRITDVGGNYLQYTGTIANNRKLVLFWEERAAYITDGDLTYYLNKWNVNYGVGVTPTVETGAIKEINDGWMFNGLPLTPLVNNTLTYSDDATSGHNPQYIFAWHPRLA